MLTKNFLELLVFSPKLNCFLISLHCLAYIMQFFHPFFNIEWSATYKSYRNKIAVKAVKIIG